MTEYYPREMQFTSYQRIVQLTSGSKDGNCVILERSHHRIILDLGISYKRLIELSNGMGVNITDDKDTIVLISHKHQDHVKMSTLRKLRDTANVIWVFFEEWVGAGYRPDIEVIPFKHGDITSHAFYIKGTENTLYITDADCMFAEHALKDVDVNRLAMLIVEANSDLENKVELFTRQDNGYGEHGYNVIANMKRHMSFERALLLIEKYQPRNVMFCHLSDVFVNRERVLEFESNYNRSSV